MENKRLYTPKISIIVPIYNSEKYLKKAITSLINQTYKNLEIILINDGSTDESLKICKEFAQKEKRIILINQENKGVSTARNKGLDIATGEYVTFIDSDDYINEDTYKKCVEIILNENVDILKFGFRIISSSDSKIYNFSTEKNIKITKQQYMDKIYSKLLINEDFSSVCNLVVKREIIKGIKFNKEIKFGEDLLFHHEIIKNSKSIYILDEPLYYYFYNDIGASKNTTVPACIKRINDEITVNERICNIYKSKCNLIENAKRRVFNTFLFNIKLLSMSKQYKDYLKCIESVLKIKTDLLDKKAILKQRNFLKYFSYKLLKKIKKIYKKI